VIGRRMPVPQFLWQIYRKLLVGLFDENGKIVK